MQRITVETETISVSITDKTLPLEVSSVELAEMFARCLVAMKLHREQVRNLFTDEVEF